MGDESAFEAILTSFVDQYGLSRRVVLEIIQTTLAKMLSQWHGGIEVMVLYREGRLQAIGYRPEDRTGGFEDREIDLSTMRGWNTIKRAIDQAMTRQVCLKETRAFKTREHELRWGEILQRNGDHFLVEIALDDGQLILAECPYKRIGKHERDLPAFDRGRKRAFHLRRIDPVMLNGTPRLRVILDRESKRLPECLLRERLIAHKFRMVDLKMECTRRIVGGITKIRTNQRIIRDAILETAYELNGERIEVKVDKQWR